MIRIKILKARRGASYKKGDLLLVRWAFCNQCGGVEYYHKDRFDYVIPGTYGFMGQTIMKMDCKVLSYNYKQKNNGTKNNRRNYNV